MKLARLKIISSLVTLLVIPVSSYAQWAVIDPTNLIQNTITAAKAIKTEISTSTTAIQNIKQTINMIKSLKNINDLGRLASMDAELGLYQKLQGADGQIYAALDETLAVSMNAKAQMGASNQSWDSYIRGNSKADINRSKALVKRYEVLNETIQNSNSRRKDILQQFAASDGSIAAATQATTASVDNMSGQLSELVSHMSYQTAQHAAEVKKAALDKETSLDIWNKYQDDLKSSANQYKLPHTKPK